jgi:hypothetical protein
VSVEPPEPQRMAEVRASDAEREEIVQQLAAHAGTGRLTLDELEQRSTLAYSATTRGELLKLTADLPQPTPATAPERRRKATRWLVSILGGAEKRGRWRVGRRLTTVTVMGGNDLDLRHAEIDTDEVTILAFAVMGGMDIYVPDTVDVEVGGFALLGGRGERGSSRAPRPGAPRIRILAYALMGGIDVWRLPEEARGVTLKQARKIAKSAP